MIIITIPITIDKIDIFIIGDETVFLYGFDFTNLLAT
jgi:hypothetical protein